MVANLENELSKLHRENKGVNKAQFSVLLKLEKILEESVGHLRKVKGPGWIPTSKQLKQS